MLIEQVAFANPLEHSSHKAVLKYVFGHGICTAQNPPAGDKILIIGVMFNVRDCPAEFLVQDAIAGRFVGESRVSVWIIKVIGSVSKGVDLQSLELGFRYFVEEPVNNHAPFDGSLGMQDQDDFCATFTIKGLLDKDVTVANV